MSSTKLLQDLETCFKDTVAHFEEFQNSAHLEETKVHELQNQVQDLQVQLVLKEAQVKDLRRLLKDSEQQAIQKFSRNSLQGKLEMIRMPQHRLRNVNQLYIRMPDYLQNAKVLPGGQC